MSFLLLYLYFFHWNFDIWYLSPIVFFPVLLLFHFKKVQFLIVPNLLPIIYLVYVLFVSTIYQIDIRTLVIKEYYIFIVQISSYLIGWWVSLACLRHSSINNQLKVFKCGLYFAIAIVCISVVSTISEGYKYVHGQNIFGNIVLFAPEWPLFSMLLAAASLIIFRPMMAHTMLVIILLAGQARSVFLIYLAHALIKKKYIEILIGSVLLLVVVLGASKELAYIASRFHEIIIQLDFSGDGFLAYLEKLRASGIYNPNLYKPENSELSLTCERVADTGRIGNTVLGIMYTYGYFIFGSGFQLANTTLLCLTEGLYHPSGPAWNPLIYSLVQGGVIGLVLLSSILMRYRTLLKDGDVLAMLVVYFLISQMIMKGLNSYQFWTMVGIGNAILYYRKNQR